MLDSDDSVNLSKPLLRQRKPFAAFTVTERNEPLRQPAMLKTVTDTGNDVRSRLLSRRHHGHLNARVVNVPRELYWKYWYYIMLDISWWKMMLVFFVGFLVFNFAFGFIYWISGTVIPWEQQSLAPEEQAIPATFMECFFFSLQTMDTIGYGRLLPRGYAGGWIVVAESFLANVYWAFMIGYAFAKLSRPSRMKRQFIFSEIAVINDVARSFHGGEGKDALFDGEYKSGHKCLVFRMGNVRLKSTICESSFHLLFYRRATDTLGNVRYAMEELDFEINEQRGRNRQMDMSTPMMGLPWTVVHKIDENSPLSRMSNDEFRKCHGEIIAVLDGIDESCSENYQARWSYLIDEILWDHYFVPCTRSEHTKRGEGLIIDYAQFQKVRPVSEIDGSGRVNVQQR